MDRPWMFNSVLLQKLRKKRGLTLRQLGDRLAVCPGTVSKFEKGIASPSSCKVSQMAIVFEMGMIEICELLRVIPYGLDLQTFRKFKDACRSEKMPPSLVVADFIKAYVAAWEEERKCRTAP